MRPNMAVVTALLLDCVVFTLVDGEYQLSPVNQFGGQI